jgi:MraZ protein
MFLGEYAHSLDDKGRVTLPRKFRDVFEGGAVIAKAMDGCLALYTPAEWERVAEAARELSRQGKREREAARTLFSGAAEVTPDRQGRIAIAAPQRAYAGLDKEVVVAGVNSRVEIWDAQRWADRHVQGEQALANAEDLPDFGI